MKREHRECARRGDHLGTARTGETVQIRTMCGGNHLLSRLASLGFTPGTRLRVIQNYGHGPIIVSVRDTRVALGRGEAKKVLIQRTAGGGDGR